MADSKAVQQRLAETNAALDDKLIELRAEYARFKRTSEGHESLIETMHNDITQCRKEQSALVIAEREARCMKLQALMNISDAAKRAIDLPEHIQHVTDAASKAHKALLECAAFDVLHLFSDTFQKILAERDLAAELSDRLEEDDDGELMSTQD